MKYLPHILVLTSITKYLHDSVHDVCNLHMQNFKFGGNIYKNGGKPELVEPIYFTSLVTLWLGGVVNSAEERCYLINE